jgi:hypothetical protein
MDTQRLEGSRFGANLVPLATFVITLIQPKRARTGGSRERPSVMFSPSYLFRCSENATADRAASRGDVPGSRLLPTDKAAIL